MSDPNAELESGRQVRIHIDREKYHSPNPTTGQALYILGKVASHHELFREVDGDQEDALVPRNDTKYHLHEDDHFYSHNDFTIVVNAVPKTVKKRKVSFEELVRLAFNPIPAGPNILITISYRKGPNANPEGILLPGHTVNVKDRMVFDVVVTDKS